VGGVHVLIVGDLYCKWRRGWLPLGEGHVDGEVVASAASVYDDVGRGGT
jgi:hypothetical protein